MTQLTETPHTHFAASAFAPQPAEERGLARDEVRLLVAGLSLALKVPTAREQ